MYSMGTCINVITVYHFITFKTILVVFQVIGLRSNFSLINNLRKMYLLQTDKCLKTIFG